MTEHKMTNHRMTKNDKPSGKRQENDKQNDKFASCQNGAFLKKLSFFVICHLCLRFFQTCHFFTNKMTHEN